MVKSWTGSYTGRTWTSDRFNDSSWSESKAGPVSKHWVHAYYYEYQTEGSSIAAMIPRADGGVSIYVTKSTFHQPQELMLIWDNLPDDYCREDDKDLDNCVGRDHPARYIGEPRRRCRQRRQVPQGAVFGRDHKVRCRPG